MPLPVFEVLYVVEEKFDLLIRLNSFDTPAFPYNRYDSFDEGYSCSFTPSGPPGGRKWREHLCVLFGDRPPTKAESYHPTTGDNARAANPSPTVHENRYALEGVTADHVSEVFVEEGSGDGG